jgi:hypothetical protein
MSKLLKAAIEYKKLGVSVIATDANKRSIQQWKKYQEHIATDAEISAMFSSDKAVGIATICGEVSGNMEVIDVDCKYDITGSLFEDFMQAIVDADPEIAKKLVVSKTKSAGYHIFYRCGTVEGNKKLAQRFTTDKERNDNPHEKVKVLIETRGEAGYVIAAPTDGYKYFQGTIRDIAKITPVERQLILDAARSFNTVIEEVHNHSFIENKPFNKSPFQDYNERGDVVSVLQKHGWRVVKETAEKTVVLRPGDTKSKSSGDYSKKLGLFSVFTTSSEFEPNKGYRPASVYAMLECGNDYKVAAKKLLAEGFGEPFKKVSRDVRKSVIKMTEEGVEESKIQAKLSASHDLTLTEAKEVIEAVLRSEEKDDDSFWSWDADKEKICIVYTRFKLFLQSKGFGLYFYDPSSTIFKIVHNDYNRLEEASNERIKKITQEYIEDYNLEGVQYTKEQLLEVLYRNNNIFTDNLYEYLPSLQIDFLRDTKDTCYIPFKNGIIEIKSDDVRMLKHGQVNKVIWKSDLIDFNVDIQLEDDNGCEFLDFVSKVAAEDQDRLENIISIIGYLLHKYKHPAKSFAVILGEETEDETKGGGTGKGVFIKAIEKMINVETIDGKNFKPDKTFAFQRVSLDTKLIAIQDVEQNFDFKKFYSIITEGMPIEKKNKDELYIKYDDSPKVILTTNYTVNDDGNHAKRRQRLIEFSNYFSPERTPLDEYGHLLFDDWDKDEWNRFYNFMFYCIRFYLKHGIKDLSQKDSYKKKKIKNMFGEEFLSWFDDYSQNGCATEHKFMDMFIQFQNVSGFDKKDYSLKRFKKGLKISSENFGYRLTEKKNKQDNNLLYVKMEAI